MLGGIVIVALALRSLGSLGRPALPVISTIPEFTLTDQSGGRFGSADLAGKVWIASRIMRRLTPITTPKNATIMKNTMRPVMGREGSDWLM